MKYVLFDRTVEKVVTVVERVLLEVRDEQDFELNWRDRGEVLAVSAAEDVGRFEEVLEHSVVNSWEKPE